MSNLSDLKSKIDSEVEIEKVAEALGIKITNHKALCPFHDDKHPSLSFKNEDKYYHCFSCNAHGNMYELVKQINKMDFKESLKWIADSFGYDYSKYSFQLQKKESNDYDSIIKQVLNNFQKQEESIQHLKELSDERKLPMDLLIEAGIIVIKNTKFFYDFIERNLLKNQTKEFNSFMLEYLISIGLLNRPRTRKISDSADYLEIDSGINLSFNYNHILIPIYNKNNKIISFAARNISNLANIPKYKYASGFKKNENLYGYNWVFNNIKQINDEKIIHEIYIVEGFFDVLRLKSLGLNALGVMGNYLGVSDKNEISQLKLIQELIKLQKENEYVIHIYLDRDEAGIKGTKKSLNSLMYLMKTEIGRLFVDVILFNYEKESDELLKSNKDPDEQLKEIKDIDQRINFFNEHTASIIEFYLCYYHKVFNRKSMWDDLKVDLIQKSKYIRELVNEFKSNMTLLNNRFLAKTRGINKNKYENELEGISNSIELYINDIESISGLKEKREELSIQSYLVTKAIDSAESSYYRSEFPYDIKAFDNIRGIQSFFVYFMEGFLNDFDKDLIESYTPVLELRSGNNLPRLKVLPSPEDLVIQETILIRLLEGSLNKGTGFQILGIVHSNETNKKTVIGIDNRELHFYSKAQGITKTLSFAYQFESQSFNQFDNNGNSIFRHYSKCWEDYNNYILECVRNYSYEEDFFAERFDISRYYDNIEASKMERLLKEIFTKYNKEKEIEGIPNDIVSIIMGYSFNYTYYSPENGIELKWHKPNIGIPQGPNLSAWLANIYLFEVDYTVQRSIEEIISNYPEYSEKIIYTRYVDDIIIIAPENEILKNLHKVLSDALYRLNLSFSDKVESLTTISREEFKQWLYQNKGMPGSSVETGDHQLNHKDIKDAINNMFNNKAGRKDILRILHSKDMLKGIKENNNLNLFLTNTAKYYHDLKNRDFIHIAKLIWYDIIINKDTEKFSLIVVAEILYTTYKNQLIQVNDISFKNDLEGFIFSLNQCNFAYIALQGLIQLLVTRYDKFPEFDDEYHEEFIKNKAEMINHIVSKGFSINNLKTKYPKIKKLEFMFDLMFCRLYQLCDKQFESQFEFCINHRYTLCYEKDHIKNNSDKDCFTKYFVYLYSEIKSLENGQKTNSISNNKNHYSQVTDIIDLINVFHEDHEQTTETLKKYKPYLMSIISHLSSSNKLSSIVNKKVNLQKILIWCCSDKTSCEDESNRYCQRSPILLYQYPEQEQEKMKDNFIGYFTYENKELYNFCVFSDNKTNDLEFPCFSTNDLKQWKESKILNDLGFIFCNILNDKTYINLRDIKNNYKSNYERYNKLIVNILNSYEMVKEIKDNIYISPYNLFYSDNDKIIKILSFKQDNIDLVKKYAFNDKKALTVNQEFNHVWRMGWALNAIFDNVSSNETDYLEVETIKRNKDNWIDYEIHKKLLFELRGNEFIKEYNDNEFYPQHIKYYVERLGDIYENGEEKFEKISFLLELLFRKKFYSQIKVNILKAFEEPFASEYFLYTMSNQLFYYDQSIIKYLKNDVINSDSSIQTEGLRRSVEAWIVLGERFKSVLLKLGNDNLPVYQITCRAKAITIFVKSMCLSVIYYCMKGDIAYFFDNYYNEYRSEVNLNLYSSDKIISEIGYDKRSNLFDELSILSQLRILVEVVSKYQNKFRNDNNFFDCLKKLEEESYLKETNFLIQPYNSINPIPIKEYLIDDDLFNQVINNLKSLEDILGIKITNSTENNLSFNQENEKYYFNKLGLSLPYYQFHTEKLHYNDCSRIEINDTNDNYQTNLYSIIKINTEIVEIDCITEMLAKTIQNNSNQIDTEKTELTQKNQTNDFVKNTNISEYGESINDNQDLHDNESLANDINESIKSKQLGDETIVENSSNQNNSTTSSNDNQKTNTTKSTNKVSDFYTHQKEAWASRSKNDKGLPRIAFFQFEVDSSYRHPLYECMSKEYCKDQKKCSQIDKELFSFAEYKRRKKLKAVLMTCKEFGVDVLLLPEYSVRPETVIYIQTIIKDIFNEKDFSVWAGTFKIPFSDNMSNYINQKDPYTKNIEQKELAKKETESKIFISDTSLESHQAVLSVVTKDEIKCRQKKYSSVLGPEDINPLISDISPIFDFGTSDPIKKQIFELICAEAFIISCPLQLGHLVLRWNDLITIYNKSIHVDDLRDIYYKDISNLSELCSDFPLYKTQYNHNRKKLLFIPAMTSRNEDFYLAGQQLILSQGVSTVFCNAVLGDKFKGGSCLITGECFKYKNDDMFLCESKLYSGVVPGIYQYGSSNSGTLGKKEEALVIFDIDPVNTTMTSPSKQARLPRYNLVAHLPLVIYSSNDTEFKINDNLFVDLLKESSRHFVKKFNEYIDFEIKNNYLIKKIEDYKTNILQLTNTEISEKQLIDICDLLVAS